MKQVKKLSVATVFGKIKLSELMKAENQTLEVMKVIGVAIGQKDGDSDYGAWTALLGRFRATNPQTGEVFEGPTVFLPDVALIPLQIALAQAKSVEFAIVISARYAAEDEGRKAGGAAYEYTWQPLLAVGDEDPLARLEARIAEQKQLGAPAAGAAESEEPAKDFKQTRKGGAK